MNKIMYAFPGFKVEKDDIENDTSVSRNGVYNFEDNGIAQGEEDLWLEL